MSAQMKCKNCNRKWVATNLDTTSCHLTYCPGCSGFWELSIEEDDYAISGEATLGRFSPRVFFCYLFIVGRAGLLIIGTLAGIVLIIIVAGLSWLSDWIFKERR